ncbi:MAG: SH3 domain-containing protein [Desulfamplus sp.]|nr:SH3 domain-containing protein [Desulfamplus sp.]MBF0389439.1 SH3 domain-containing protein [Desulfamplus sp.]
MLILFAFLTLSFGVGLCEERLSVKAKLANVRSSPKVDSEVLWKIEMYYPIIVVEKKDGWVKFKDFENDIGWIHGTLVDKIPSVITTKDKCNVRKGPGQNEPLAFTVERGVPFKVLERKDDWVKVQHADGDIGWIFKSLLW